MCIVKTPLFQQLKKKFRNRKRQWIIYSLRYVPFKFRLVLSTIKAQTRLLFRVGDKSNTTGATCVAGTAYLTGAPDLTSGSQLGWCCSTFCFLCNVMKIVVCPFVPFLLVIVLSILLLFTASDYPFGIFKHFCYKIVNIKNTNKFKKKK
jgi:hypothetical protein